jgi:hypothetical protein
MTPRSLQTLGLIGAALSVGSCSGGSEADSSVDDVLAIFSGSSDYCAIPDFGADVLAHVPAEGQPQIDDVNWFARPVFHGGDDWIIAFASHDQNYIYNLSTDRRVMIPDRSDAVATPDGRYMTVPSSYTPDSSVRFYPVAPMLEALSEGRDIADLAPAFIHEHPSMEHVYYQSTALISQTETVVGSETIYRLMFSGGADESNFRIVDYLFRHRSDSGELLAVEPSEPMAVCPAIKNDLNTPFMSKDGRYVAAYTSETAGSAFSSGASLKIYELTSTDPSAHTTSCSEVADLGFAAGKADFSFDNSMMTFHLSQGGYLTPFVTGGLRENTITDVMVARLDQAPDGSITGHSGLQRLSTSLDAGVGSYFPAFFPDGKLFFLSNSAPREAETGKRFDFRVVDPSSRGWRTALPDDPTMSAMWARLGTLWQDACTPTFSKLGATPFPLQSHELPLQAMSLNVPQCEALVRDAREGAEDDGTAWDALAAVCSAIEG